jgi:hypothetical protein
LSSFAKDDTEIILDVSWSPVDSSFLVLNSKGDINLYTLSSEKQTLIDASGATAGMLI